MAEIRVNSTGALKLYDSDDSNFVGLQAGSISSDVTFTLPTADGSNGQALTTNGSGALSFSTISSNTPSSADGQALGSTSAEWSDLYLADGGIIYFGNDQDVTLTHNADTGLTLNGVMTATTLEPSADTSAGDNAAIGYTASEGLILTGQGSTDDITIKNDADTTVLNVATGATDVEVSAGNILFGTADKGIYLGVTSATAANLLADYEEGSWTPTVTTGGANPDFSSGTQRGRYVKVGKLVFVHCEMKYTSSSSNTGQWGGLPFSTSNEDSGNLSQTGLITDDRNTTQYHNVYIANDTKWYIRAQGTMSGGLQSPSDFSGQIMSFNHTYLST